MGRPLLLADEDLLGSCLAGRETRLGMLVADIDDDEKATCLVRAHCAD